MLRWPSDREAGTIIDYELYCLDNGGVFIFKMSMGCGRLEMRTYFMCAKEKGGLFRSIRKNSSEVELDTASNVELDRQTTVDRLRPSCLLDYRIMIRGCLETKIAN